MVTFVYFTALSVYLMDWTLKVGSHYLKPFHNSIEIVFQMRKQDTFEINMIEEKISGIRRA